MKMFWVRMGLVALVAVSTAAAAKAEEIIVGSMVDITGSFAALGSRVAKGAQLASEEINQRKLLQDNTLKFIQEDTATEKAQALTLLNRFARSDKALLVMGPVATPLSLAVSPIANELQIPLLTTSFADQVLDAGPWSFKFPENNRDHVIGLLNYAIEKVKPKKCFFVYSRDNDGLIEQMNVFRDGMKNAGVQVAGETAVVASDTDFSVLATKIVAAAPDCLHLSMIAAGAANLILQSHAAGLPADVKIFGAATLATRDFIAAAGPEGNGVMVFSDYTPGGANDEGRNFEKAYTAKYNEPPDNWATIGYAQMMHIAWAIKQASPNPTREKVRDVLKSAKNVPTIIGQTGVYGLDDQRRPKYGATVVMIKDGRIVKVP